VTPPNVHPRFAAKFCLALLTVLVSVCGIASAKEGEPVPAISADLPSTLKPGAKLELLYAADRFFEGPTWDPKTSKLYFTSFPFSFKPEDATHILRWDSSGKATIWLDRAEGINGTRLSTDGRLLGAQVWSHRIMSYGFGPDGPTDARALYSNDKLIQPNDVCQAPNGNIYFSDPDFDHGQKGGVYLFRPNGEAKQIISLPMPNGVVTSLDGSTLYVGENRADEWLAYPVKDNGDVGEGRVFFKPPAELAGKARGDGMTVDEHGNLYFAGECCFPDKGGVWVVSPAGKSLGRIPTPEFCSNATFGGPDGTTLYMTCRGKLYSIEMSVHGGTYNRRQAKDAKDASPK
jgi:gluconolactonase